ncbi:hypothetical protein OEZ86_011157 [Tetradesmus obliquus]|nr:hypothetical protein OEZ86_011157 [Tetradesmus obliquus]
MDYRLADEPVAVLNAAIQELVGQQQAKAPAAQQHQQQPAAVEVPQFLPAPRFLGPKQGYYFGTAEEGTGYYRDGDAPLEVEAAAVAGRQRQDPQELLRQAEEQADAAEVQLLDEKSLRKMLNALDKRAKENLELRMKYADEPMRFIDNEVDLMSLIRGLAQVAADPNALYPLLIDSTAVATLAGLLSHDNTDIAVEVMDLLQELTDSDEEQDNQAVAGALVDALAEANGLELLVERMAKLSEAVEEEAAAVNHGLAVIEHAVELRPALAESLLERGKLLKWLLGRIRVKASDSNKQYASEILSILVQGHEANQRRLGSSNGIDTLLVCLAGFKSREPADAEEQEFVENLFDTLCSCLLLPANRAAFVECEGVELMHLLLKGKKSSRYGAIKAIDFATTRCPPACDRLVEAGALAQLFAIFMGRSKIKNSKGDASDRDVAKEVEERCVSIISNLFQGVTKNSRKERLAAKFVEAEFEKVDRLMELLFRYEASVRACEVRLAREAAELDEEVEPGELLLERLDAGLFTLQCAMVVVAALWSTGDAGLRRRLLACLHQKGQSLEMVRQYLLEFYFGIGDDGAPEEKQRQLQRLGQLLAALNVDVAAEAAARQGGEEDAAAAAEDGGGQDGQQDADAMDMELDDAPSKAAAAAAAKQQQQHQGNGIGSPVQEPAARQPLKQQQEREQQQQQGRDKAAAEEARPRDRERDRERGRERDLGKERDRERERKDRERERERDRSGRDKADRTDRDRGDRGDRGERGDRGDRGEKDRSERQRSSRRSSRSRSRSRSPPKRSRDRDREEGGHRGSGSSRHKRSRRSRSRSRSR